MLNNNISNCKLSLPTVVFVGGVLNTKQLFYQQQSFFANKFNVYNADIYHFDNFTDMADDLFHNTTGDLIIIGLSIGGYCVLEALRQDVENNLHRIKGLYIILVLFLQLNKIKLKDKNE